MSKDATPTNAYSIIIEFSDKSRINLPLYGEAKGTGRYLVDYTATNASTGGDPAKTEALKWARAMLTPATNVTSARVQLSN